MAVNTVFTCTGVDKAREAATNVAIARALGPRPGHWRVDFIGNQTDSIWEMRVKGPTGTWVEHLVGERGEHQPEAIAAIFRAHNDGRRG